MMKKFFLVIFFILLFAGINAVNAQTWNIGYPNATDVTATFSGNTLTISGTGAMQDYSSQNYSPWWNINNRNAITTVVIDDGVTNVGNYAFIGCRGLISVILPNSVTSIGDYAFYSCESITSIIIPNSITSIGGMAFIYCYNLTSIIIPNRVTSIGFGAFWGCSNLTTFTNLNPVPQNISGYTFFDFNFSAATLIVPCGSLSAYQTTSVWQSFRTIIENCPSSVSNVKPVFSCPGQVTVTYDLNTSQPVDVTLYYSHNKRDWLIAQTVTGDLTAQSTGTGKTITWNCFADNVRLGKFYFKVEIDDICNAVTCNTCDTCYTDITTGVIVCIPKNVLPEGAELVVQSGWSYMITKGMNDLANWYFYFHKDGVIYHLDNDIEEYTVKLPIPSNEGDFSGQLMVHHSCDGLYVQPNFCIKENYIIYKNSCSP